MIDSTSSVRRVAATEKSITSLVRYFILIPLLLPQGLGSLIPGYKIVTTLWAMASLAVILLDMAIRLGRGVWTFSLPFGLVGYFIVAVAVTVFSTRGIVSGLQELFLFPAFFLYLLSFSEDELREYAVACLHILCVLFSAQLLAPSSLFAGSLHMTMLGHVQVFSQYGLLAIMLASLVYLKKWSASWLPFLTCGFAIACMIGADADSAHFALIVFFAVLLLLNICPVLLKLDLRVVTLAFFAFSLLVVRLTVLRQSPLMGTGFDWTFSGRLFVWESADALFRQAPLFGRGIENSIITTFWSSGMSYAHNQIMQCLIDGGIVLLIAMIWMFCAVAKQINNIVDTRFRIIAIAALCALLFVMIFDSFTPYSYAFILLAFIAREGMLSMEGTNNGI